MPEAVDLAFAFGLEPRAAVEYFRSKGYAITFNWEAMAAEAHARAFTVAKVMNMDVLQSIREELDGALAHGYSFEHFRRNLEPRLKALGWWGNQVVEGPDGGAQIVNVSSPHRLETIFRTNLQSAYMAGSYRDFMGNVRDRPYFQYIAVMDNRTRPAHAAMHGKVFRFDDPIWETCWPPNGYNCRCRVRALSEKDVQAKGLAVSSSKGNLKTFTDSDPATGEVFERVSFKAPGMDIAFSPDRGFAGNQALSASVSQVDAGVKSTILGRGADDALREIAVQNWGEWTQWVDGVVAGGKARGSSRVLGYALGAERDFVQAQGLAFATGALEMADRLIVPARGASALDVAQWKVLPLAFASREAVLFDSASQELLYVLEDAQDPKMRIVVVPGLASGRRRSHDPVQSVRRVSAEELRAQLTAGAYRLVTGAL